MGDAVVKTDVDKLIELVEQRNEISFDEASKVLNIPFKVIESLAGLLEEENVLHIVYKFTTPYIVHGSLEKSREAKKSTKEKAKEAVIEAAQEGLMKQEPEVKGEAGSKAKTEAEAGESESIVKTEIERREEIEAPKEEKEPLLKTLREEGKDVENLVDDLAGMVEKAKMLAEKGDIEEARELFLEIKKRKTDLSKEYLESEKKLKGEIAKLNDYLILGLDKALSTDFSRKHDHLNSQIQKAWGYVKDNKINSLAELKEVEEIYEDIRKTYFALPKGFMEKRVSIQNQMLELYRIMIANKKQLLSQDFATRAQQIQQMINTASGYVESKSLREAEKFFNEINKNYAQLPEGFLKQKTELQTQILNLYQRLISGRETFYEGQVQKETQLIDSLLRKAYTAVHNKDIVNARKFYDDTVKEYSKFPKGFLNIRAKFEEQLLELHRLTSLLENTTLLEKASKTVEDIKHFVESANSYVDSGEYDFAQAEYDQLVELYNSLPKGLEGSDQLRDDIIELHNRLLPKMLAISDATESEIKTYNHLMKYIVKIHEHIRKKEFNKIKQAYFDAYKLYHELPLRFLNKKTGVYAELQRVYQELKLYSEAVKLDEYVQNKDYNKLKRSLEYIHKHHPILSQKYANDRELFDFVKQKYLIYSELLKKYMYGEKEEHKEVKEKLAKMAEKTHIKDVKVPAKALNIPKEEEMKIKDLDIDVPQQA